MRFDFSEPSNLVYHITGHDPNGRKSFLDDTRFVRLNPPHFVQSFTQNFPFRQDRPKYEADTFDDGNCQHHFF